jgi:hypothetical protein
MHLMPARPVRPPILAAFRVRGDDTGVICIEADKKYVKFLLTRKRLLRIHTSAIN